MNTEMPEILFKYRPLDKYAIRTILYGELYFADPANEFNDPFDCKLTPTFGTPNGFADHIKEVQKDEPDAIPEYYLNLLRNQMTPAQLRAIESEMQKSLVSGRSIVSLTKESKNILMFSHYADHHKGVQFGFNSAKLIEVVVQDWKDTILVPVDYRSNISDLRIKAGDPHGGVNIALYTKSVLWCYEHEFRLISKTSSGPRRFGPEILSEVVVGCQASDSDVELVTSLCKHLGNKPRIFRAIRPLDRFELDLEEIA